MSTGTTTVTTSTDVQSLFIMFLTSLLAIWFTKEVLFHFTNHAELWMFLFLIVSLYLWLIITTRNFLYSERSRRSRLWKTKHGELLFLQLTALLIVLRLGMDYLLYAISVSDMKWSDYVNLLTVGLLFIFVLLQKLQEWFKIEISPPPTPTTTQTTPSTRVKQQ